MLLERTLRNWTNVIIISIYNQGSIAWKIQECGHENKSGHCSYRHNIQLWNENEDIEIRREQKLGYCVLPQIPVIW